MSGEVHMLAGHVFIQQSVYKAAISNYYSSSLPLHFPPPKLKRTSVVMLMPLTVDIVKLVLTTYLYYELDRDKA